ncbi:PREDICTED: C3 and PZP-like alpha-2-macroglobulin domain-containing protein 8 [Acropora digitifera]|uniref:C3 and PZP-like alpha-2-macroglobulin domain-containing protein 8 n=1 Tax=Acropora digitifera TaxID=70779 RepID=UPI00077A339E|nr:PREDICTED: C3 and PZP-like alpha-2-macroglobulin domain-containing protein 8 [Acropora digitifera]
MQLFNRDENSVPNNTNTYRGNYQTAQLHKSILGIIGNFIDNDKIVNNCTFNCLLCSGILVTSPRLYRAGSTQELTVSLFSEPLPWIVNATLAYSNSIIDTDEGQFTSLSDGTLKLKVNLQKPQIPRALIGQIEHGKVKSLQAKLTIIGGQLGGRRDDFQSSEMITIKIPKISLFIQTDKPIYKPGQTGNKTNHLYSFMDGSLKAETCISQSITS